MTKTTMQWIRAIRRTFHLWRQERIKLELTRLQKEQALIDQTINHQTHKLNALQTRQATPKRRRNPGANWFALR